MVRNVVLVRLEPGFTDADAYRGYDLDKRHNELRAELGPRAEQIARLQFGIPD